MISNNEHESHIESTTSKHRPLQVESLEDRNLFAVDLDDSLSEARPLGIVGDQPLTTSAEISEATDVDIYRVTLASDQSVDIDVDTPLNGPGGLGGYLRVFNEQGVEVAANNDAMSPDDVSMGFDPYIRFTAPQNGNYYIAISNWENTRFDPVGGEGDVAGQQYATGSYSLSVKGFSQFDTDDAINEANSLGMVGPTHYSVDGVIDNDVDVDMFRIDMMNGQSVEFDIDTAQNGPGGLGSYLTLFDSSGNVVASNNDGAAPGESLGFDAYLRLSVAVGGPYYLAVSNYGNTSFSPVTGNGDTAGSMYATGAYRLTIGEVVPNAAMMASESLDNSDQPIEASPSITSNAMADSRLSAPMIDSSATMANRTIGFGTLAGSGSASELSANSTLSPGASLGASTLNSPLMTTPRFDTQMDRQLNTTVDVYSGIAAPAVDSPLEYRATTDQMAMSSQPGVGERLNSRTALATDLALVQSI